MTHDFQEGSRSEVDAEIENRIDRLVELLAWSTAEDPGAATYDDERFVAWWRAELRAWQRWDERAAAQQRAAHFAQRLLAAGGESPAVPKARVMPAERLLESPCIAAQLLVERQAEGLAPWLEADVAAGDGGDVLEERCDRLVVVPPELPKGSYVAMTVRGDSMLPALHPGDVVLARLGGDVVPGSLVVARRRDGLVVKRLRSVAASGLTLQSANPDFGSVQLPADRRLLIGSVAYIWCAHDGRSP